MKTNSINLISYTTLAVNLQDLLLFSWKGGFYMPQFNKRGNRIRASDKSLVFCFSAGSLLLLFLTVVMLLNLKTILTTDWKAISLFNDVDIVSVFDLIVFSYQGVRMYSKLIPIDEDIPQRIIEQIKKILVKE